ncbi:sialate O-acetylesterase [Azonexus sp.]|uniref:sialate O-acetylesterase n=1 Tax=Azonexus sp. TaxID=1872668 RepID=UPI0035AF834F
MTDSLSSRVIQFETDAELMHQIVQGDETADVVIGGVSVPSIRKLQAQIVEDLNGEAVATAASMAASVAVGAKEAAEAARDSALIQSGVYVDEPTGRAAVADGQAFKVQGTGDIAALEYRRTSSLASVLIAIYPAASYITKLRADLEANGLAIYKGAGPVLPIVTDSTGRVLLGYDTANNSIVGDGISSLTTIVPQVKSGLLGPAGQAAYVGSGLVIPLITDAVGQILLGYDTQLEKVVGRGLSGAISAQSADAPLSEPPVAKSINHLLFYGQSLSVGATATTLLSTTQPYSNLTFSGGPRAWTGSAWDFSAFKPLVEDAVNPAPDGSSNRGETVCSGAANYASTLAAIDGHAPAEHVILTSTAGHGGYRIDQLNKGTAWYSNLMSHIGGAKALNADYAVHAFGWIQGENDIGVTDFSTYRSRLAQLQLDIEADAKSISGQTSPAYCITYQVTYGIKTSTAQALAQLDLAQKCSKFAFATACYHLPYAGDNVHLTNVGYKWLGAYFGRAYKQIAIDGMRPKFLNPLSATRRGNVIRVKLDVPSLPLVLDTWSLALTTDYGFKVMDGDTQATISSVATDGSEVVITLSAVPAGEVKVRYALDYLGTGLSVGNGASGNLRDSTPDMITIAGTPRPLYHVAPHFELTAIALGE